MTKPFFAVIALLILFSGILHAEDYKWDLVNALINSDNQKAETIIKNNINKMSAAEKRLVMNFVLTYSGKDTTEKAVNLLLSYNVFPNDFDLYTAVNRNHSSALIQLLIQNGAAPNGEILLLAMEKQRFDLAKQFIETGADVNYQYPLARSYADGMTPLLYASKWNDTELVKLLVKKGAKINTAAKDGNTALSLARKNENNDIVNFLLENGAVEQRNYAATPPQNSGITGVFDNQATDLQRGTYRVSGGASSMKLTGSSTSGSISYVNLTSSKTNNGIYRITGNSITIVIDGYSFVYRIDSNESFSGNGEIWVRTGN